MRRLPQPVAAPILSSLSSVGDGRVGRSEPALDLASKLSERIGLESSLGRAGVSGQGGQIDSKSSHALVGGFQDLWSGVAGLPAPVHLYLRIEELTACSQAISTLYVHVYMYSLELACHRLYTAEAMCLFTVGWLYWGLHVVFVRGAQQIGTRRLQRSPRREQPWMYCVRSPRAGDFARTDLCSRQLLSPELLRHHVGDFRF